LFARHPVLRSELLARYSDVTFYEEPTRPTENQMIALLADRDAAIVGLEPITENVLAALPNLKAIGKFGIGCEWIDFDALRKYAIPFGYTPGTNRHEVAEVTLAFMIATLRLITPLNAEMRAGLRPRMRLGRGLNEVVVGLHGCGNVGKEVVKRLQPFGCTILACDIADYAEFYRQYGVTRVSMDELLAQADVVSLHLPKTAETIGLYDGATLVNLRPNAVLINTCRGGIVDERALYERLTSGAISGAAFDVFDIEPTPFDALLQLPNFLATPHMAANTDTARLTMGRAAIEGLTKNELVRPGQTF
jgi:phosphoglycerate dehydrogenase-like enzyme